MFRSCVRVWRFGEVRLIERGSGRFAMELVAQGGALFTGAAGVAERRIARKDDVQVRAVQKLETCCCLRLFIALCKPN